MLLKVAIFCLAATNANVFGRPRTLAQKANRVRVRDLVARYDQIQTPVDAVHVQSSVNEETPTGKVTEREGMLLDVSLSGVTSEELPANRYKVPDDKTRKVQQPFDWVALTDHN
jgi:hypothetical protein